MTTRQLTVVSAGLSQPSSTRLLADRLAQATAADLHKSQIQAETNVIELRDLAHEIADNMLTGFASGKLREAIETLKSADALIAVSPIFTASYSGLFKSFFDVLDNKTLIGKPTLIGATGGTARHSLALEHELRPLFAYLRATVVPTAVYAASEDWGSGTSPAGELSGRIERAGSELSALIANQTQGPELADEFADFVPFEQQLADLKH